MRVRQHLPWTPDARDAAHTLLDAVHEAETTDLAGVAKHLYAVSTSHGTTPDKVSSATNHLISAYTRWQHARAEEAHAASGPPKHPVPASPEI